MKNKKNFDPSDEKAAENAAVNLIKYRMRSEKELIFRLKNKGFEENVIYEIIEKFKKYNLLNDKVFAYHYAYDKMALNNKGSILIYNELKGFGIEVNIIIEALNKIKEEIDVYSVIKNIIEKKFIKEKNFLKIKDYLYKRGFEREEIESVINDIGGEE